MSIRLPAATVGSTSALALALALMLALPAVTATHAAPTGLAFALDPVARVAGLPAGGHWMDGLGLSSLAHPRLAGPLLAPSVVLPEGLGGGVSFGLPFGHGRMINMPALDLALVQPELRGGFAGPGFAPVIAGPFAGGLYGLHGLHAPYGHGYGGGLSCQQSMQAFAVSHTTDAPALVAAAQLGQAPGWQLTASPFGGEAVASTPVQQGAVAESAGCDALRELGLPIPGVPG